MINKEEEVIPEFFPFLAFTKTSFLSLGCKEIERSPVAPLFLFGTGFETTGSDAKKRSERRIKIR